MPERGRKTVFLLLVLPALLRAAWRLRRLEARSTLDRLPHRLRAVKPFTLPYFRNPAYLAGSVDRFIALPFLKRSGACWTRSLLLLDLLSRSRLVPRLHLGLAHTPEDHHLHAWLTIDGEPLGPVSGHREIWSG